MLMCTATLLYWNELSLRVEDNDFVSLLMSRFQGPIRAIPRQKSLDKHCLNKRSNGNIYAEKYLYSQNLFKHELYF